MQRAHRLAIAFENLDVALGRPLAIDSASVFDKLVRRRRGGLCFEHNQLLLDALAALGFDARPLLGRAWLGASDVPPPTHALALVDLGGEPWIADAGFGGGYTPPMPLVGGTEATGFDGARFALRRDPTHGWMLSRDGEDQYSFTGDVAWPIDTAISNHWVQTAAESRFVQRRLVSIALPNGHAALDGRRYRRRAGAGVSEAEIDDPRVYRLRLSLMFGIDLTADEVMQLGLFD